MRYASLRSTVFVIIIFFLVFVPTNAEDKINFSMNWSYVNFRVSNMPFSLRNVSIHKDDGYASQENAGPIQQKEYNIHHFASFSLTARLDTLAKNLFFELGYFVIVPTTDRALRNYTNAVGTETRGYGAALTYCEIYVTGTPPIRCLSGFGVFLSMFTPTINLQWKISDDLSATSIRLKTTFVTIEGANGWDRYDRDEIKDGRTFGYLFPTTLQVDIPVFQSCYIGLGIQAFPILKTKSGQDAKFSTRPIAIAVTFGVVSL